jgi:hypothetical protein
MYVKFQQTTWKGFLQAINPMKERVDCWKLTYLCELTKEIVAKEVNHIFISVLLFTEQPYQSGGCLEFYVAATLGKMTMTMRLVHGMCVASCGYFEFDLNRSIEDIISPRSNAAAEKVRQLANGDIRV